MRRWVTWITLVCFVTTQTAASPVRSRKAPPPGRRPIPSSGDGEYAECIACRAGLHHDAAGNHVLPASPTCRGGQCPPDRLRHQHR